MDYIVTIIVIANILSVIYAANNNRHTWFIGLIATVLTTIVFFNDKHFMSFLYNLYSSIMCLAGIICWKKNEKDNERSLIRGNITTSVGANIILFIIIYLIDVFIFKSNNVILDSIGTSTAILGTYLLVKKDINSWYFWIAGDIAYCTLSFATDDYKYIIMYGTLLICAIYGCIKNNKLYNKKKGMKLSAEHFNFGEALEHLKNGLAVTRHAWENNMFVVKQINADIDEKVIPHMTSLPQKVKELILQTECKSISYQQQCLIVQLTDNGNIATNYIPNWIDIFADDWTIVGDIV